MAFTAQRNGLSVASVASKMSVVVPVIFAVIVYHEKLSFLKIIGILLALLAVYLTTVKKDGGTFDRKKLLFPALLFIGSGVIDTTIKYVEKMYVAEGETPIFSAAIFGCAAIIGVFVVTIRRDFKITGKTILGGIALGIPNFYSIVFLLKALRPDQLGDSSTVFPINNVAIVMLSTIFGILFFKEKLILKNWIGIALEIKDTYKTIDIPSEEVLFKDRNSKFFGYAFPVSNEDDVKKHLEALKKSHHSARHWCYAWQFGKTEPFRFRANDDGEPSNSAGMPIYGQIQSFDVTDILIVVVRYFGGTKLGVGGLINAYRTGAQLALEASEILEKTINIDYLLVFDYKNMNKVMRVVKERNLNIIAQKLELDCRITISVRQKDAQQIFELFENLYEISIEEVE